MRAKRALTPAAATPQGKARSRSLGDEWGAAVDSFCCMYLLDRLFYFCLGDASDVLFLSLALYFFCTWWWATRSRVGGMRMCGFQMLLLANMAALAKC